MSNINFTPEQLAAAKAAKSPEELVAMAKEAGITLSAEQAVNFFGNVKDGVISDDELDNVAGGGSCNEPMPDRCPKCKGYDVKGVDYSNYKEVFECFSCGHKWNKAPPLRMM